MAHLEPVDGFYTRPLDVVAWGDQDQFLTFVGVGADQALWSTTLDGISDDGGPVAWLPLRSLGGMLTSAPTAVRSQHSIIDVFAAGPYSELLHYRCEAGVWRTWLAPPGPPIQGTDAASTGPAAQAGSRPGAGPWPPHPPLPTRYFESLGGTIIGRPNARPAATAVTCNVYVVGTDHAVWMKSGDVDPTGLFSEWSTLGFEVTSAPVAVETGDNEPFVFARGLDGAIWYSRETALMGWQSLGGTFASAPATFVDGHSLHVLATGIDCALRLRSWDGSSWSDGWRNLGGTLMSGPTACGSALGTVHVYARGADSAIWCRHGFDGGQETWERIGGPSLGAPRSILRTPGYPVREVVSMRTDRAAWHVTDEDP